MIAFGCCYGYILQYPVVQTAGERSFEAAMCPDLLKDGDGDNSTSQEILLDISVNLNKLQTGCLKHNVHANHWTVLQYHDQ
jgi:hypothetical protein